MKELLKKDSEIIRYLIIGVLTTMVSLGVYYILTLTIFDPKKAIELQITNIISWIASVTFAYFTNRSFVFQQTQKMSLKEAVNFYLSRLSTLGIDMIMMYILVTLLGFNDKIIKLIVQVVVIVLNYVFSKFFVFNKKEVKYEK